MYFSRLHTVCRPAVVLTPAASAPQGDIPPTAGHLTNSLGRDVTPERDLSSRDVTFDMDESLQYPLRSVLGTGTLRCAMQHFLHRV